jgi:mRNA-degrading endonuclease toxin of MazEF toxin-antitoxin module
MWWPVFESVSSCRVTRVLPEQTSTINRSRLGKSVGYLGADERRRVGAVLRTVLEL